eukprot:5514030-Amphidinium_carterae.1
MLLSAIVWKPRKDVMKLLRGHSQIGASSGPQAEDAEQPSDEAMLASMADSTGSDPLEHGDDEEVITTLTSFAQATRRPAMSGVSTR